MAANPKNKSQVEKALSFFQRNAIAIAVFFVLLFGVLWVYRFFNPKASASKNGGTSVGNDCTFWSGFYRPECWFTSSEDSKEKEPPPDEIPTESINTDAHVIIEEAVDAIAYAYLDAITGVFCGGYGIEGDKTVEFFLERLISFNDNELAIAANHWTKKYHNRAGKSLVNQLKVSLWCLSGNLRKKAINRLKAIN